MADSQTPVIPVLWVAYDESGMARGYYDEALLEAIFDRSLARPPCALDYESREVHGEFPDVDGAVVVLPSRHHTAPEKVAWFNDQLARLRWAVIVLAGDEEWAFPWRSVRQDDRHRVWIMQPKPEHAACSALIPGGWYPQTRELLAPYADEMREKPLDWFFGGQLTHARREACIAALAASDRHGEMITTKGYLQGVPREEYARLMASAKIAPSPSGPCSVDTARPLEAMEAGAVPICDLRLPGDVPQFDYWTLLFGEGHPLPTIADWGDLPQIMDAELAEWPANTNRIGSFWARWKRDIARKMDEDVRAVAGLEPVSRGYEDDLTIIVTTSPVEMHPDTDHIEQTVGSIRAQLPNAELIVVADGVRPEQEELRPRYEEYLRRVIGIANYTWGNAVVLRLEQWGHQANAMRVALDHVRTPLILFAEHDTPIMGEIDWAGICGFALSGKANEVRLHFDVEINPDHYSVMVGAPVDVKPDHGKPLRMIRTVAHWQRPQIARTDWYRDRVLPRFSPRSRTMIEDKLYGIVWTDWKVRGDAAWHDWRLWIYAPEGNMKRSGHLDSRNAGEGAPKFDMIYD